MSASEPTARKRALDLVWELQTLINDEAHSDELGGPEAVDEVNLKVGAVWDALDGNNH